MPDKYSTKLNPIEEALFRTWATKNKVSLDPGWNEDYDMRGLWKANPNATPDERGHWPDTYKLPNHPTFSDQSIYATSNAPHWYGNRLIDFKGNLIADETKSPLDLPVLPSPRKIKMNNIDSLREILYNFKGLLKNY